MITKRWEKRLLQNVVALAALVPIFAGAMGVLYGIPDALDNHFRYLSGLLFGIGICFVLLIPRIEHKSPFFFMLTFIVVIGGLARLAGMIIAGTYHDWVMLAALIMELMVTPLLCLWQRRVAKLAGAL